MEAIDVENLTYNLGGIVLLELVKTDSFTNRMMFWSKLVRFNDTHTDRSIRNRKLCLEVQQGNVNSAELIVTENEALITLMAKKVMSQFSESDLHCDELLEEKLIQEGRIILLDAAKKYDLKKFTSFTTYAQLVLERGLRKYCEKELNHYENKITRDGHSIVYLDEALEQGECQISDLIEDNDRSFVDYQVEYSDHYGNMAILNTEIKALAKALSKLDSREFMVVDFIYGLTSREPHSLKEAAKHFLQTQERIREIELDAIGKLRHEMKN